MSSAVCSGASTIVLSTGVLGSGTGVEAALTLAFFLGGIIAGVRRFAKERGWNLILYDDGRKTAGTSGVDATR